MDEKADRIRKRAHELWEKEGKPHGRHDDHWIVAEQELSAEEGKSKMSNNEEKPSTQKNEGEGNRTAARAYNKHVEETVKSGTVEKKAKAAEAALDGPEAADLKAAEAAGKKHAKT